MAPVAPVAPPTAPVAAPVAEPTAPVTEPTAPVTAPVADSSSSDSSDDGEEVLPFLVQVNQALPRPTVHGCNFLLVGRLPACRRLHFAVLPHAQHVFLLLPTCSRVSV